MKASTSCRRKEAVDVFKKRRACMINSNMYQKREEVLIQQ